MHLAPSRLVRHRQLFLVGALVLWLTPASTLAFQVTNIVLRKPDLSTLELEYFNQARCLCNGNTQVEIQLDLSNKPSGQRLKVVAGLSCLDENTKAIKADCAVLVEETEISTLTVNPVLAIPAQKLMGKTCAGQEQEAWNIFVYVSDPADQTKWSESKRQTITVDTKPPDKPKVDGLVPGERSVRVNFTAAGSTTGARNDSGVATQQTTVKGYQVLCEKLDKNDAPLGPGRTDAPAAAFDVPGNLCPGTKLPDGGSGARDASAGDAAPRDLTVAAEARAGDSGLGERRRADASTAVPSYILSPTYVCSDMSTSGPAIVKGLVNHERYRFYLVAIDKYKNPSPPASGGISIPIPVEDLWKSYKKAGGGADGEFCFVATAAYGSYDHPQVRILRAFRDRLLLRSRLGRIFVGGYYRHGAAPAAWLSRHPGFRPLARAALWPLTIAAAIAVRTSTAHLWLATGLLTFASLLLLRRRRARRGGDR